MKTINKFYILAITFMTIGVVSTSINAQSVGVGVGVNANTNNSATTSGIRTGSNVDSRIYNDVETRSGSISKYNNDVRVDNRVDSNSSYESDLEINAQTGSQLGTDSRFDIFNFND